MATTPGADDVTDYTLWTSTDVFKDGYVNEVKRKKDTSLTPYLITTLDDYDYFGNAKSTKDPDGTFTCRTWDGNRNFVNQVREAMVGQTSCATSNANDLTTSFERDTALRITKTTRPVGNCEHREYDAYGRLEYTKLRDDCNVASTGHTERRYYSANGFNKETEYLDAASTVTREILRTDFDSTQVARWQNPVSPGYSRDFTYFTDGQLERVTHEAELGKTEFARDDQNRETSRKRHLDASGTNFDLWTLAYPTWPSGERTTATRFQTVTDEASKATTSDFDDLGRKNRVVSPDSNTTVYVHDAASRTVTMIETATGGATYTHAFTYDNLGRKLTEDYDDLLEECDGGSNQVEVSYVYDTIVGGCPGGASCTKQQGRLAKAKTKLLCITGTGDGSMLEQETFFSYDDAGRLVQEYIQDDDSPTPRIATQSYAWDKNGNLKAVTAPSSAAMTYTLGGAGNSDSNLISEVIRSTTSSTDILLNGVTWTPFGPVLQYDQANTIGGNALRATVEYNKAYRPIKIAYSASATHKTRIDYVEDEKGRFTQKVYSNVHSAIQSNYLQYDWFDRIICDSTVSGTCPFEGSTVRTNIRTVSGNPGSGYNNNNDREAFFHYDPAFSTNGLHYTIAFKSGKDQIDTVYDGSVTSSYTFDQRGNRTQEDEPVSSFDKRDYTYDQRRRVRTISGKWLRIGFPNTWRDYRITYAWDHRDRLVYRSYKDLTGGGESRTFYYWDVNDRLIEVKHTPLISDSTTFSIYDFYWLGARPVAQWTTNFPAATTARYFMHADEANRVLEMHDWPLSGDATLAWAYNPDAFGWDRPGLSGPYQPLRLNNAIWDDGSAARKSDPTFARPALLLDNGVHYDPMLDNFLQSSGRWPNEQYTLLLHAAYRDWRGRGGFQVVETTSIVNRDATKSMLNLRFLTISGATGQMRTWDCDDDVDPRPERNPVVTRDNADFGDITNCRVCEGGCKKSYFGCFACIYDATNPSDCQCNDQPNEYCIMGDIIRW